jgi:flagellar export protein FliJ
VPKFQFNLETLLRHREEIEQKEKDELLRLTYQYQTELNHRYGLSLKFRDTMEELSLQRSENRENQELNLYYLYLNRLTLEIGQSEKRLAELQAQVQAQKEAVIEASKKRKALTSLRSKREKEFAAAVEKQEQKEVDDLVITRYGSREAGYRATVDPRQPAADKPD